MRSYAVVLAGIFGLALGIATSAEIPQADGQKPQVVSPLGKSHFALPDKDGAIEKADKALAANPASLDLLLEAGRARDSVWRYNDAIEIYSKVIERAPNDVRGYRFRGHRYVSTRRFDQAVADLEKAASLAPTSFDVAYHLALAYFLRGQFDRAASVYRGCLEAKKPAGPLPEGWRDCSTVATGDDESRIAISDWLYRSLRRAGKHDEARTLAGTIAEGLAIKENEAYYRALLFYKGLRTEEQVLDPASFETTTGVTTGFGVGNYYLVEGQTEKACKVFRRLVEADQWNGFGFIAAETELTRKGGPCQR
jgi:tetratricopeptide (TPR) repeat protein